MKTVNVFKAQAIRKGDSVEDLTMVFDTPIEAPKTINGWEPEWREQLQAEGRKIADALCDTLPGGVIDALLVELLDRKRSMCIIPSFSKE